VSKYLNLTIWRHKPTERHWSNDLSEFKCIMCRGRRNQSTDYMKQPLKFLSWDKQHTFSTSETTSQISHSYSTRHYSRGCKEHNRADDITKITKRDWRRKQTNGDVSEASNVELQKDGGRLREGVLSWAYFMLASQHLHGKPGKTAQNLI